MEDHVLVIQIEVDRREVNEGLVEETSDLREATMLVVVLLGVVVARDPVCLVVTCHGELREFTLDDIEVTILPPGELIAEAEPVVEETEADGNRIAIGLLL